MDEALSIFARGLILVLLFGIFAGSLAYCDYNKDRHWEEMKRLELIENGCLENSE